jgi:hypothetical protein
MRSFVFAPRRVAGTRAASTMRSYGIIQPAYVESVCKWEWSPFCEQFAEIVHDPTLSLPTGVPLWPAAAVFAQLSIKDKLLRTPPKHKKVFEHCGIETAMKQLRVPVMADGSPDPKVLEYNKFMVEKLADARQEELAPTRYEKNVDMCAQALLMLCGFNTDPLTIAASGGDFKIFGKTCYGDADYYVVKTPKKDVVLIVEDKSLKDDAVLAKRGHLGQTVGELLQLLSVNRDRNIFRSVFALRFVNYRVTAFRVHPNRATLTTLCDTRKLPESKLQLMCSELNPAKHHGLSLIDPAERLQALRIMSNIRQFIVTQG